MMHQSFFASKALAHVCAYTSLLVSYHVYVHVYTFQWTSFEGFHSQHGWRLTHIQNEVELF